MAIRMQIFTSETTGEKLVTIPLNQFMSLMQDSFERLNLEAHGVDSWEGFDQAIDDGLYDYRKWVQENVNGN